MNDNWEWNTNEPTPNPPMPPGAEMGANTHDPELVSIIIPVYNRGYDVFHYTGNCIGSVREHTDNLVTPYELIVVDNGSPIKMKNLSDWKADKVVTNQENKGVAYAWNQGIRVARGGYICLLNNDTMVFDHWLEDLKKFVDGGILDFVMSHPMYGDAYARATDSTLKRAKWLDKSLHDSVSDFRDFACVLAKKDLYDEVGLFDEQFTLGYGEDLDFLKRMDKAGKTYGSTELVPIFHIIGATSHGMPEIPELMNKNRELLKSKWENTDPKMVIKEKVWDIKEEKKEEVWGEDVQPASGPAEDSPLVRCASTGDKVFFLKESQASWVTNPEVLEALGYGWGDIRTVSQEEFYKLQYGPQITMENVKEYAKKD